MFLEHKARELAYSILRSAVYVRRSDLRSKLERWSLELLEDVSFGDFEKSLKTIKVLKSFINFSQLIFEIEPINAGLIIKELSTVDSEIRQTYGLDKLPDLSTIFSESDENDNENGVKPLIRQSAIIEKIRQKDGEGCQLKDLTSSFPEVSERTLRYDLQKLINQNLIARVGDSGPGTTYFVKS